MSLAISYTWLISILSLCQVQVQNHLYNGTFYPAEMKFVEPRAPYRVTNVHADNSLTNQPTIVGLNVTWTPREFTGSTIYRVCLIDRTTSICNFTDKNSFEFPNLLGYWIYNIKVQATTKAGVSEISEPVSARTDAKIPGQATFTLIQDAIIATKLSIVLTCPEEKSRIGIITKYIINLLNLNTRVSENQTETPNINCGTKMVDLKNIKAEHVYSISVQVQNHVYSGTFSPAEMKFVESRAPILPATTIRKGLSQATSTVKVDLCVTCILDDTQGKVVDAGLIVCLDVSNSQCYKQGRRKRYGTYTSPEGFSQTWSQSQSSRFVMQYRTTPDNWLATLKGSQPQLTYTIGNDNCNSQSNNYCNGPLPSNTRMKSNNRPTLDDNTYYSIDGSTVYNNPFNEMQGNIYNEPDEEFSEIPPDYGYITVLH